MLTSALTAGTAFGGGVVASATGGGGYTVGGTLQVSFSFNAIGHANGSATGRFFHSVELGGQLIEFEGRVTCVTMDAENHRASSGGAISDRHGLGLRILERERHGLVESERPPGGDLIL